MPSTVGAMQTDRTLDCLLNCLREVRLEKFYRNFTERGVENCDQLAVLAMHDYQRYGITTMEDRVRLFKLIQIIKSVQSDGIHCQHGVNNGGNVELSEAQKDHAVVKSTVPAVSKNRLVTDARDYRANMNDDRVDPRVETNGEQRLNGDHNRRVLINEHLLPVEVFNMVSRPSVFVSVNNAKNSIAARPENPRRTDEPPPIARPAHGQSLRQPGVGDGSRGDLGKKYEQGEHRPLDLRTTAFRTENDSPLFKCRKALNFSDCDSDDDDVGRDKDVPALWPVFTKMTIKMSDDISMTTAKSDTVSMATISTGDSVSMTTSTSAQPGITTNRPLRAADPGSVTATNRNAPVNVQVSIKSSLIPRSVPKSETIDPVLCNTFSTATTLHNSDSATAMVRNSAVATTTTHKPDPPKVVSKEIITSPRQVFINPNRNYIAPAPQIPQVHSSATSVGTTAVAHAPLAYVLDHRGDTYTAANHAYFPLDPDNGRTAQPSHIEQIFHNSGYNYGVPSDSPPPGGCSSRSAVIGAGGDDDSSLFSRFCPEKICVCVRKRPRNVRELKRNELDIVKVKGNRVVIVDELKVAVDLTKFIQQHVLTFDVAFDENCDNRVVYERAVKPLISCVFDKGSAICFAFGQTGAGKTYTLLGNKAVPGMYELAAEDLFAAAVGAQKSRDSPLCIWASYYEIYCGHIYDLFNKRKRLHIRENSKKKVCISGLMENHVKDVKSLTEVIRYGNAFRSRGNTGVNPNSSRSHALLQLEIRDIKDYRIGRMTFIDLAGSERASDATHSDRHTRMEGAEINQSLLALKECIRSIDQQAGHTPYRQSKLTHILRDSLSGNAQTVMIANIAPTQSAVENTLNTLRYADRVQQLRKESAMKAVHLPSPAPQTNGHPNTPPTAPSKRPLHPSLFHPHTVPFSSTPVKSGGGSEEAPTCTRVRNGGSDILQYVSETPISGHRLRGMQSGASVHGRDASSIAVPAEHAHGQKCSPLIEERISPINDSSPERVIRFINGKNQLQNNSPAIGERISPIVDSSPDKGHRFQDGGESENVHFADDVNVHVMESDDNSSQYEEHEGSYAGPVRNHGGKTSQQKNNNSNNNKFKFEGRESEEEKESDENKNVAHNCGEGNYRVEEREQNSDDNYFERYCDGQDLERHPTEQQNFEQVFEQNQEAWGSQTNTRNSFGQDMRTLALRNARRAGSPESVISHVAQPATQHGNVRRQTFESVKDSMEDSLLHEHRQMISQVDMLLSKASACVDNSASTLHFTGAQENRRPEINMPNKHSYEDQRQTSNLPHSQHQEDQTWISNLQNAMSHEGRVPISNQPSVLTQEDGRQISNLPNAATDRSVPRNHSESVTPPNSQYTRLDDPTRIVFAETKACMAHARENIREFLEGERHSRAVIQHELGFLGYDVDFFRRSEGGSGEKRILMSQQGAKSAERTTRHESGEMGDGGNIFGDEGKKISAADDTLRLRSHRNDPSTLDFPRRKSYLNDPGSVAVQRKLFSDSDDCDLDRAIDGEQAQRAQMSTGQDNVISSSNKSAESFDSAGSYVHEINSTKAAYKRSWAEILETDRMSHEPDGGNIHSEQIINRAWRNETNNNCAASDCHSIVTTSDSGVSTQDTVTGGAIGCTREFPDNRNPSMAVSSELTALHARIRELKQRQEQLECDRRSYHEKRREPADTSSADCRKTENKSTHDFVKSVQQIEIDNEHDEDEDFLSDDKKDSLPSRSEDSAFRRFNGSYQFCRGDQPTKSHSADSVCAATAPDHATHLADGFKPRQSFVKIIAPVSVTSDQTMPGFIGFAPIKSNPLADYSSCSYDDAPTSGAVQLWPEVAMAEGDEVGDREDERLFIDEKKLRLEAGGEAIDRYHEQKEENAGGGAPTTRSFVESVRNNLGTGFELNGLVPQDAPLLIADIDTRRSRTLMIGSHEQQLTAITILCKQEMGLLLAVKSGHLGFDDYIRNVQSIQLTKSKIIEAFIEHINEFHYRPS